MEYRILLIFLSLLFLQTSQSQECIYQYMHQPNPDLDCNPYGRELQLHCGFIGPLSPEFNLQWYSSNATNSSEPPLKLQHVDDYTVNNIVLDLKTGHYVRSVSSVLLTGQISNYHRGKCLWCQAEFQGIAHPLKSNALCIKDEEAYLNFDKCSDTVIVNTSLVCANVTAEFMAQVEKHVSDNDKRSSAVDGTSTNQEPSVIRPSPSAMQTTTHAKSDDAYKQTPSLGNLHTISMETAPSAIPSVSPTPPVMTASEPTAATATDLADVRKEDVKMSEGALSNQTGENMELGSTAGLEGALYAAIVFCVVFVVVIVLLVAAIVCLSKNKCGCLTEWMRKHHFWKKSKVPSATNAQGHALGDTVVAGLDMQTALESGLHNNHSVSYKDEETDRSGKFDVQVNVESTQANAAEHSITRSYRHSGVPSSHRHSGIISSQRNSVVMSFQHSSGLTTSQNGSGITSSQHSSSGHGEPQQAHATKRKSRSIEDYPLPALPPKPRVLEISDVHKQEDKCDYDHLSPVSEEDKTLEDEHQYAELEEPLVRSMSDPPPPPKPPRHPGPHLYHTLESSEESGVLRSTTTSQAGSQQSVVNEYDTPEGIEVPPGAAISNQLKELFDDPRYAILCVNQDHLQHIRVNRRRSEVSRSRSTPSLVAVDIPLSPSATERRSLRAVHHKRLSILNSHLFSGQYN